MSEKFVNPYTFIGLGNAKSMDTQSVEDKRLTGVLNCTLTTKTPLFIPNTSNKNVFHHKVGTGEDIRSYDFYSYDNLEGWEGDRENTPPSRPIIPGSSIRGMVRSAYEALTNSCLSTINEDTLLSKRSTAAYDRDGNKNPDRGVGIVEKNGEKWVLKKGDKALMVTNALGYINEENYSEEDKKYPIIKRSDLTNWQKIHVSFSGKKHGGPHKYNVVSSANEDGDTIAAYFIPGEPFGDPTDADYNRIKRFDTVIYNIRKGKGTELTPLAIERIKKLSKMFEKKKNESGQYIGWGEANPMPVYYENVGGVYYISPACISQEVFNRKINDIISGYEPCQTKDKVCKACALFGMVGTDKENDDGEVVKGGALASRLSFRDATPLPDVVPNSWYEKVDTFAILGQPRPSATEFYMEDPGKQYDYYNYDYTIKHEGGSVNQKALLGAACIRGRKFYWHSDNTGTRYAKENDRPDLSITARPVAAGKSFKFDIVFQSITQDELDKLIWTLTIGGNSSHKHKMGHGKPIGFGSVQIDVNYSKSKFFELDSDLNIVESPIKTPDFDAVGLGLHHKAKKAFERVTSWNGKPSGVTYPPGLDSKGQPASYVWFGENRKGRRYKGKIDNFNQRLVYVLPDVMAGNEEQQMLVKPTPETTSNRQQVSAVTKDEASHKKDIQRMETAIIILSGKRKPADAQVETFLPALEKALEQDCFGREDLIAKVCRIIGKFRDGTS